MYVKTFNSKIQAEDYADRNYYPGSFEIYETIHGNWGIKKNEKSEM